MSELVGLSLDVTGLGEAVLPLSRVIDAGRDMRPLWNTFVPVLRMMEQEHFDSEGGGGRAGAWAPLSPAYARWKAGRYPGRPILVAEGTLRSSLVDEGATGQIVRAAADSLVFGTSDPTAIYHQMGTSRMPKRPPLDIGPAHEAELADIAETWLGRVARDGR